MWWTEIRKAPSIAPYWNWNISCSDSPICSEIPSIAPYWNWNWNQTSKRIQTQRNLQSHLTGIEIKDSHACPDWFPNLQSHLTGIEILYPGCLRQARGCLQSHLTGIEIYVYDGDGGVDTVLQSHLTGIEISRQRSHKWSSIAFNRTLLELKYLREIAEATNILPSIAPYWNWNNKVDNLFNPSNLPSIAPYWNWNMQLSITMQFILSLQSHLTGIEICQRHFQKWQVRDLQSHLTGIEIYLRPDKLDHPIPLQSHLTGIEIQTKKTTMKKEDPFNRTLLELGPSVNKWSLRIILARGQIAGWDKPITRTPSIAPYWNWNKPPLDFKA